MAMTPVEQVRFLIGIGPTSPFYSFVSDAEIEYALEQTNGNVRAAAKIVAFSLLFQLAGYNTREKVGDEEIWNTYAASYLAALRNFVTDPGFLIPSGLMPWSANTCPSKLMSIEVCDGDACREACDCACESTSVCNCVAGPTF